VLQDSEIGCLCVSCDYAFALLAPPSQSRRALFCRFDSANHTLAACHSWRLPRTEHIVPLYYHAGMCLFYYPASYTEVAGSPHGGRSSAWGSCNRPGLPRRLISPAGLLHIALSLYFHLSMIFERQWGSARLVLPLSSSDMAGWRFAARLAYLK